MKTTYRLFFAILVTSVVVAFYWISLPETNEHSQKSASNDQIIVYNKVSKCGSTALITITKYLAMENGNNFTVAQHADGVEPETFRKRLSQEQLAIECRIVVDLPRPVLYARHVYYMDLSEFGLEKPTYINLIRDPVDRFVSNFYFNQFGSVNQNRSPPSRVHNIDDCVLQQHPRCAPSSYFVRLYMTRYFCGHDEACGADERESIEIAKRNIESDYIFIGITEEFETSLKLLENVLPNFFSGALDVWHRPTLQRTLSRYKTVQKGKISAEAQRILQEHMWADYEIYRFVRERFERAKRSYGIL